MTKKNVKKSCENIKEASKCESVMWYYDTMKNYKEKKHSQISINWGAFLCTCLLIFVKNNEEKKYLEF